MWKFGVAPAAGVLHRKAQMFERAGKQVSWTAPERG
jgi:hypothetical protein